MSLVRWVLAVAVIGSTMALGCNDAFARRGKNHPHHTASNLLPSVSVARGPTTTPARSYLSAYGRPNPTHDDSDTPAPPTYATAPRGHTSTYGPAYFERSSYAGPSQRGSAYNVKARKTL
jgi:hypothetical protein